MICCRECFADSEIRAAIEMIGHRGRCPICNKEDVYLYDSETDKEYSDIDEKLNDILEIYVPESELPITYPEEDRLFIEESLIEKWRIFAGSSREVRKIVEAYVEESWNLDRKILNERVGIPDLYDESFLTEHSLFGIYNWDQFKKCLRNGNRFHCHYMNIEVMGNLLGNAEDFIPKDAVFFRARVSNERGAQGYRRKEMGAPPDDVATPGRVNSKGQSCLYLSNKKETTVKEIRAHAFDYVTIAKFRMTRTVKVLNLNMLIYNSPFQADGDKVSYLINEEHLRNMSDDMSKPMSRWDSELDYLPTQYISDFAKACGYDGVQYSSTFDKESYNVALFEPDVCKAVYHKNYLIGNLDYRLQDV